MEMTGKRLRVAKNIRAWISYILVLICIAGAWCFGSARDRFDVVAMAFMVVASLELVFDWYCHLLECRYLASARDRLRFKGNATHICEHCGGYLLPDECYCRHCCSEVEPYEP